MSGEGYMKILGLTSGEAHGHNLAIVDPPGRSLLGASPAVAGLERMPARLPCEVVCGGLPGRGCPLLWARISSGLPQMIPQLSSSIRQSILLFAAVGFIGDGHFDEAFGKSRLHILVGQIPAILQS